MPLASNAHVYLRLLFASNFESDPYGTSAEEEYRAADVEALQGVRHSYRSHCTTLLTHAQLASRLAGAHIALEVYALPRPDPAAPEPPAGPAMRWLCAAVQGSVYAEGPPTRDMLRESRVRQVAISTSSRLVLSLLPDSGACVDAWVFRAEMEAKLPSLRLVAKLDSGGYEEAKRTSVYLPVEPVLDEAGLPTEPEAVPPELQLRGALVVWGLGCKG